MNNKLILDFAIEKVNLECELIPVILSGGKGTRLWPLSRECFPKQYLNLDDNSNYSLLQNTFLRLIGIKNLKAPIVICNEEQRFIVAEQMRGINVKPQSITLEPFGRDTAPAIALAALQAIKENKDPTLLILSADHKIDNHEEFRSSIKKGLKYSEKGRIVTFGVVPDQPETGFGYIESFEELSEINQSSKIKRFVEKPSKENAKMFIKNKCFTWNSGIFLFKASVIIREILRFEPDILNFCKNAISESSKDLDFLRIEGNSFAKCPNIPIDIAVMEKTNLGTVIPLSSDWNDIGSWNALWEKSKKDKKGNTVKGKVIIKDTENCYLRSEDRLVVGLGLKDIVIVETEDAVLVSDKYSTQKIKNIVNDLFELNFSEGKFNKRIFRPWGSYTSIVESCNWKVKKLQIKPGASLSLQKHNHRSEHWVVVNGEAKVEVDKKISILKKNESAYIPLGSKHRLSNPGEAQLILIEVQSGSYLGEDDIVRFDDIYGRIKNQK